MTPPLADFVLLPATNGASAENGASPKFQTGRSARRSKADHPSQAHHLCGQVSPRFITLITFAAQQQMNRDYVDWLTSLPCNQRAPKINTWMGGWAPLPEEIDLPAYEDWQDRENQRNPKGLMACLRRWVSSQ